MSRVTFVVGRLRGRTREIQWVRPRPAPLPGPWGLKALVREHEPRRRLDRRPRSGVEQGVLPL